MMPAKVRTGLVPVDLLWFGEPLAETQNFILNARRESAALPYFDQQRVHLFVQPLHARLKTIFRAIQTAWASR